MHGMSVECMHGMSVDVRQGVSAECMHGMSSILHSIYTVITQYTV
jgi:hypothetical protein